MMMEEERTYSSFNPNQSQQSLFDQLNPHTDFISYAIKDFTEAVRIS